RLARTHALRRGVEFGQHAALAEREDEVLAVAASERLAIGRAAEIHGQAIFPFRRALDAHEARALPAQDADGLVHRRVVDAHLRPRARHAAKIAELHFRVDLERGAELERRRIRAVFLLDARE